MYVFLYVVNAKRFVEDNLALCGLYNNIMRGQTVFFKDAVNGCLLKLVMHPVPGSIPENKFSEVPWSNMLSAN